MRFAWPLTPTSGGAPAAAGSLASDAERWGYDVVWIDDGRTSGAVVAASLVEAAPAVRVVVAAELGADHPVELAEEITVADLTLGGRLTLVVRPAPGTEDRFAEALDLLLESFGAHPFRHEGTVWPTPANLPQNRFNLEDRIRVTPPPAQLELSVWVAGATGRDAAVERSLGVVVDADEAIDDVAAWWSSTRSRSPWARGRLRRTLQWAPPIADGRLDVDRAVAELRERRRALDLDLVVVRPPSDTPADQRRDLMADLATEVRPRVQLDRLPPGLEEHWSAHRAELERQQAHTTGGQHG